MLIRETIEAAFESVPYPGDAHLTDGACEESDDIQAYFRGTTWRGHSAATLRRADSAFFWLTEEALHYFLPAFLIAAVEDPETADVILNHISWGFTAPRGHKPKDMAAFARRIGRLTPEQRGAMLAVFEHLRDRRIFDDTDVASLRLAFQLHAPNELQRSA